MKRNPLIVILIILVFFVISFLTNILGPINPDVISSFKLSYFLAGFLPFAFFVAYGVMSIPAGILVEMYSDKKILIVAFTTSFIGALLFAIFPTYIVFLLSLFLIGLGMSMLQVVINPLLRVSGGEENFAFYSVLAQLFFGAASFLSPLLYSYMVQNLHTQNSSPLIKLLNQLVPESLKWVSVYWVFAIISILMILIIYMIKFPKVVRLDDEKIETGSVFKELLKNKYVILFFIGIFAYVGTEQGISNWTSKFLQNYHNVNPETTGANVIAWFWGLMTIGCLLGLGLLKLFDSRVILVSFAIGAVITLSIALFASASISIYAFPITGFFLSVMWSIVVSLGLNSVAHHHGTFSGILCSGIAGGAIVPLIIGGLADLIGLRFAMMFIYITLAYVLSIGIWAKPLVNNATIRERLKEMFQKEKAN
jgi:fucose permease